VLGDTHTGKTSLVLRFVEGHYKESRSATVGAFFLTKRLTLDSMTCKLLLWDTAGQEQFQKLAVTYYKQAAAAIVCYDVSAPVEEQIPRLEGWLQQVQRNIADQSSEQSGGNNNRIIVLSVAACKSDLPATPGIEEEARRVAERYGALYVTTSAKNDTNVSEVFVRTAEAVLQCQHEAATGRGRSIPVTMGGGGASLRHRSFSPTSRKGGGTGAATTHGEVAGASGTAGGFRSRNRSGYDNNGTANGGAAMLSPDSQKLRQSTDHHGNHTDSSTAGDSDDNMIEQDGGGGSLSEHPASKIICDNGMLVCGSEGSGQECVIL